ncbi:hypothetical protein [Limnoglobus roseus]|uniref:2-oxoacid dehydrogenase acyltransferase catalytic domain-containing protein n=1 Tax=Limnoglobus roseus TaxID=2598579 RepID=A0A5C1A931_9BACT|nr:hypothetical protein [Limnoglobus roseus]QEL15701.1 hypothetical protein PX52LOC_02636 [Limnoglobus roseus]
MRRVRGRWISVSQPRRVIAELMRTCHTIPIITIETRMQLAELVAARNGIPNPPSWVAVFAKAFGIVAKRRAELRRSYMPWPWPHFYETEDSIGTVSVEREFHGEPAVFFGQFRLPDQQTLTRLQEIIDHWRTTPVEQVRDFKRLLRLMWWPRPVRRFCWWYASQVAGRHRTRQFGTFAISTTASTGATCINLISPVTATLNYGLLAEDGSLDVRLHFDHRVMDGMPAARALAEIEDVLRTTILAELREMAAPANRTGVRSVEIVVSRER